MSSELPRTKDDDMPHSPPREGKIMRWLPRTPRQLGRRGAILLTFGIGWLFIAAGSFGIDPATEAEMLHQFVNPQVRGILWLTTGLIAILYAWRPPGMADGLGFAALFIMPGIRVLSYTFGWLDSLPFWPFTLFGAGDPEAWRLAAVYGIILAAVIICAGWQEPMPKQDTDRFPLEDGEV